MGHNLTPTNTHTTNYQINTPAPFPDYSLGAMVPSTTKLNVTPPPPPTTNQRSTHLHHPVVQIWNSPASPPPPPPLPIPSNQTDRHTRFCPSLHAPTIYWTGREERNKTKRHLLPPPARITTTKMSPADMLLALFVTLTGMGGWVGGVDSNANTHRVTLLSVCAAFSLRSRQARGTASTFFALGARGAGRALKRHSTRYSLTDLLTPPSRKLTDGAAQFVGYLMEKSGAILMQVWFPDAKRDYTRKVNFIWCS